MKARVKFLLLNWLAAFLIVMALFAVAGSTLQDLPLPLRALVISGVLSFTMAQVGIPLIVRFLRRRARPPQAERPPRQR